MTFILKISDSQYNLKVFDLFHMDSESELFTKLFFLNEIPDYSQIEYNFKISITSLEENLIQVFPNSITEVNYLKKRIYHTIIEKQEEYLQQNRL